VLSYSLYIWQQSFTDAFPWGSLYPPITNSIWVNLAMLFVVAYASYTFFEKPLLALRKKYSRTPAFSLSNKPAGDI
jgi:peptidoglycan/LPS O-acetylase OafA/YrhL